MRRETAKTRTERDLGPRTCWSTRVSSPMAHVPVLSPWVEILCLFYSSCVVLVTSDHVLTEWNTPRVATTSQWLKSLLACLTGPKTILNKLFGKLTQLPGLESLSSSFVGLMFCLIFSFKLESAWQFNNPVSPSIYFLSVSIIDGTKIFNSSSKFKNSKWVFIS